MTTDKLSKLKKISLKVRTILWFECLKKNYSHLNTRTAMV